MRNIILNYFEQSNHAYTHVHKSIRQSSFDKSRTAWDELQRGAFTAPNITGR